MLSGDDHDICEHTHPGDVKEYTLATFSMLQGNKFPGFATVGAEGVRIYSLPPKLLVWEWYIYTFVFSVISMLVRSFQRSRPIRYFGKVLLETVVGGITFYFFIISFL